MKGRVWHIPCLHLVGGASPIDTLAGEGPGARRHQHPWQLVDDHLSLRSARACVSFAL